MFGALTLNVSFLAALLLITLWLIARHEADMDWSKLMMVSAVTGLLSIVPPMLIWSALADRFHWELVLFWPLILLATLAWRIGIFVVMLNRFVWVPVPKALLAWVIVQAMVVAKDGAFAVIKGQSVIGTAWTSVTGMDSPAQRREMLRRAKESDRRMNEMKKAMAEGNLAILIGETNPPAATKAVAASSTRLPPATPVVPTPVAPPPAPVVATPVVAVEAPAAPDPDREASRKLLVVNGRTQQKGRTILLVKGRPVEVGDTVSVTYNGRRFVWRLVAVDKDQPRWE